MSRFFKVFLVSFAVAAVNTAINPYQASSQTLISINDSLVVARTDSACITDSLPTFLNLGHFCSPIRGRVISHFGPRRRRFHSGTDFYLQLGDSVRAAFNGVVSRAQRYYGYGLLVTLKHNDEIETYYAHLSKMLVKVGDTISVGKVIGLGGRTGRATGTHLHFEFRKNRIARNPEQMFDFAKQLVLIDSIPARDSLPTNKPLLANNGITAKDSTLAKSSTHPSDSTSKSSSIANNIVNAEQVKYEEIYHTIVKSDTLYSLARHYGTTVNAICELNNIKPTITLRIGKKLKIK